MQRSLPLLILILISSGVLFFRLGTLPLSGADEPRYARIAQEMHERGDWITPHLEGKPWLEKPPLYYWITSPFYSLIDVRETVARIGPAFCALASVLAIFFLGSALWSRRAGMFGALILLTSLGFIGFGRSASTDMPFTACLTISMAILAVASQRDIGWKVLAAYVFLGLAVLAKGPAAVILVAGAGILFWILDERGVLVRRWKIIPGLVVAAAVSLPWFWLVFAQNGYAFLLTFFINHNLARYITDVHHHSQPFYYFLPVLIIFIFPWSGWLVLLASKKPLEGLKRWREWNPQMVFLACWFLFPVIFFSLSTSKLAGYVLPSLPPLALILGARLAGWIEKGIKPSFLGAAMAVQLLLSVGMAIAAPVFFQQDYGGSLKVGLIISIAALVPAVFAFAYGLKGNCLRAFRATAVQGVAVLMAVVLFALPILGAYHSTREIAQQAMAVQRPGEPLITYRFFHHSLHYYTGYRIAEELDSPEAVIRFAETHSDFLVITKSSGHKTLQDTHKLSITRLHTQGDFLLLRVALK